jgi:hypothetical protein
MREPARAVKTPNGDYTLFFGETQSICPFVPAIPMQGAMGQVQLMRMPCTSSCPLVELLVEDKCWICNCSHYSRLHKLQDEPEPKPEEEGKILRIGQ